MQLGMLKYYLRRLRHLQWTELLIRGRMWTRRQVEQRRSVREPEAMAVERLLERRSQWLRAEATGDPASAAWASLQSTVPPGWWLESEFWDEFARRYPLEASKLIEKADSALGGHIELFQWRQLHLTTPVLWSAMLTTDQSGEEWPDAYYGSIAVHHDPRRPERDVRWCWELNRFQHLLWLGAAWRLSGDERFARAARTHLASWIETVCYPRGVHWVSNLEVGLRALSWIRCHMLCLNSSEWVPTFTNRFLAYLYLHGMHLEKELTLHHPPGNHLLGEAAALFCLAVLYPLFLDSDRWRETAVDILNRLVPLLIHPDGVYAEQSTGYFRFICELLLPVIDLARRHGIMLSSMIPRRLSAGLKWAAALSPRAGATPMIGDADTGLAIGWRLSDYWDFTPLLAAGAVLCNQSELSEGLHSFPAESHLMLGESGQKVFEEVTGHQAARTDGIKTLELSSFPDGGYQVSRSPEFSVVFDCGQLGLAPHYAHGHADGLSLLLYYRGRRVLLDTGTGLYNGPRQWREYFRSSAAHNTLTIDGGSPIRPLDTFRWSDPYRIEARPVLDGHKWHLFEASIRWANLTHSRTLLHMAGEGVIIVDRVQGEGEHDLELRFHFDAQWKIVHTENQRFLVTSPESSLDLVLFGQGSMTGSVITGSLAPLGGWSSSYYGCRIPIPTVIVRQRVRLPAQLTTVIKPSGCRMSIPPDLPSSRLPTEMVLSSLLPDLR
jgi:hypothetical protein